MAKTRKHGTGSVWTKPTLNNWYISFYRDGRQHQVNTKLPKTAENVEAAEAMLAKEVAKLTLGIKSDLNLNKVKYEDLRAALVDALRRNGKTSLYTSKDGKDHIMGTKWLDKYFEGMPVNKMTDRLPKYPAWVQSQPEVKEAWEERIEKEVVFLMQVKKTSRGLAKAEASTIADAARDASINRSLSTLRSMYGEYSMQYPKALGKGDIPYMPRIGNADNVGRDFVSAETYKKILAELPENLRPIIEFMFYTGMRSGAAKTITWSMVSPDTSEISIPAGFLKNREPYTIPLVGPLEPIRETLKHGFRTADMPIFTSTNLRRAWNKTCAKLGLGILDNETQQYHGLHPHDLRRSAARNMIRAGVSQTVAMKITGHKSSRMFERYNITNTSDMADALTRTGNYLADEIATRAAQSAPK